MADRDSTSCAVCGVGVPRHRKFCSWDCYLASKALKPKQCKQCGKSYVKSANHQGSIYCSDQCFVLSRRVDPHVCVVCGALFTPIKYRPSAGKFRAYTGRHSCSAECAYIDKGRRTAKRMAETRDRWVGPNNPMWVGSSVRKNKSYRGPDWPRIAEQARKRDKHTCKHCGMTQQDHLSKWGAVLEVHHIVPFYQFTDHNKANRLSNLVTLCKSCHATADRSIKERQVLIPLFDEGRKKAKEGIHRGSKNARALLNDGQVREIKALLRAKVRQVEIAEMYGVKKHVISAISTGQNWSHVT